MSAAVARWRALLGPQRVHADRQTLVRCARTTASEAPRPVAVIRPGRAEQLPAVLAIARTHRVSLYPISRGRNWGWGEARPVTDGQAVLDLGDLDRIVEVNATLGYAVVEPGVTQGQLARTLAAEAPQCWLESTNAGPETSIVGNTVERGLGMGDRTASVCGVEAVLPDGSTVRTGFGNFPGSRVTHVARWGVGPNLDGLFSQSNLGIVTRMGLCLAPRPEGAECCLLSVGAPALARLVDAMRPLRLRGVLPTNVHVFPVRGADRPSRWLAVGALYGAAAVRQAHRREIEAAVKLADPRAGKAPWFESAPCDMASALRALAMQATPGIQDLFRAGTALCTGEPFAPSPDFLLGYLGGAQVQKTRGEPTSADPLDHDYGLCFHWVTTPAVGRDLNAAIRLVRQTSASFGFRPQLTVQLPNGRAAVLVLRICFNRRDAGERKRASRCHRAVLEATVAGGFPHGAWASRACPGSAAPTST